MKHPLSSVAVSEAPETYKQEWVLMRVNGIVDQDPYKCVPYLDFPSQSDAVLHQDDEFWFLPICSMWRNKRFPVVAGLLLEATGILQGQYRRVGLLRIYVETRNREKDDSGLFLSLQEGAKSACNLYLTMVDGAQHIIEII
jgi:hypothetical protein